MKLTCVTAVFNAIKSGNRENLIRCVRSVAALKTEHEHLIYDGGSTDGTVELLRELEAEVNGVKKIGGENRWTADGLSSVVDAGPCPRQNEDATNPNERGQGPASTSGGESGAPYQKTTLTPFIIHHSTLLRPYLKPTDLFRKVAGETFREERIAAERAARDEARAA